MPAGNFKRDPLDIQALIGKTVASVVPGEPQGMADAPTITALIFTDGSRFSLVASYDDSAVHLVIPSIGDGQGG